MANREKPLDTTIEIATPENIAFNYRLAGPFRRLPAFLIDFFLRMALVIALAFILVVISWFNLIGGGAILGISFVFGFLLEWLYGGFLESYWNGQTVGKRLMGIRVISTDGQPINGVQAMMRNFLRYADMLPTIPVGVLAGEPGGLPIPTCAIAVVVPLLNARFQRLGDLVCRTMVVMEERSYLMEAAKFEDPRVAQLAAELPPSFTVSRSMAKALATYVDRRSLFSPARRREIAEHLAKPLLEKFGLPSDTSYDLLLCSIYHLTYVENDEEYEVMPRAYMDVTGNPFSLTTTQK